MCSQITLLNNFETSFANLALKNQSLSAFLLKYLPYGTS